MYLRMLYLISGSIFKNLKISARRFACFFIKRSRIKTVFNLLPNKDLKMPESKQGLNLVLEKENERGRERE